LARCSCGGGTCSCVIEGGSGITVQGAGSTASPYTIDATGDFSGSIIPIPTDTVLMSITGTGTDVDPILISARATVSMSELDDVSDATAPQEGEVPVWTVDHWEFKIPASAPPGTVNRGAGIIGDGSAGNPLIAAISGNWGAGSMAGFPADTTTGQAIYTDIAGQLRTRPIPIVRHAEDPIQVYGPDWKVTAGGGSSWAQWGPMVFLACDVTYKGATKAGGNIGNQTVCANNGLRAAMPTPLGYCGLGGGMSGPLISPFVHASRGIQIGAIDGNYSLVNNGRYWFSGVYMGNAAVGSVLL
jgi:hypothetical protein